MRISTILPVFLLCLAFGVALDDEFGSGCLDSLVAELRALAKEESSSYHLLLWKASHLLEKRCVGNAMEEVQAALSRQGLRPLKQRRSSEPDYSRWVVEESAYTTIAGYEHDLVVEFASTGRGLVIGAHPYLICDLNIPYQQVIRHQGYPKGTVVDRILNLKRIENHAKRSIIERVELTYHVSWGSSRYNWSVFRVWIDLYDEFGEIKRKQIQGEGISGLDPLRSYDGESWPEDHKSVDALAHLGAMMWIGKGKWVVDRERMRKN